MRRARWRRSAKRRSRSTHSREEPTDEPHRRRYSGRLRLDRDS
jgi:hypothetical protein